MRKCFFCRSTENVHRFNVYDGTTESTRDNEFPKGIIKSKDVCLDCMKELPDMDLEHAQRLIEAKQQTKIHPKFQRMMDALLPLE